MAKSRKLTDQEKEEMNELIRPGFGPAMQVENGSYEEDDDGPRYNLGIGVGNTYVSEDNKRRIAKMLKEKYKDVKYFSGGIRIA